MDAGVFLDTSDGRRRFFIDDDVCLRLDESSDKANAKMVKVFLYCYLSLLSDSPLANKQGHKPFRLYVAFYNDIVSSGLKTYILRMADLAHQLISQTQLFGTSSITGDFLDSFKDTPIFREYLTWFRTADPELLKYIYTFLNFGKKLWYVDEQLNSIAFRDWEKVEEKLSGLTLPPEILPWLRKIMRGLISPGSMPPIWPKFGPGAVAEKGVRGTILKANHLKFDARLDRAFFHSHFVGYGSRADDGYSADAFFLGMKPPSTREHNADVARLRFVPKTVKTARSICMETNTRMCFQQAYLSVLLHLMDNSVCRRFIRLEDQGRNRLLANYGSYTSEIDTLDLSAASDSVHVNLVRSIFPKRELYYLLSTRSRYVDVGDLGEPRIRKVSKFAPMGSALCFPVQSLIFTSVVVLAAVIDVLGGCLPEYSESASKIIDNLGDFVEKHFERNARYTSPLLKRYQPAGIYGDDICVDRRLTPVVTSLLTSLGFTVNTGKSFTGSQAFRESCGGYYWSGFDVTPLYFRVPYHKVPNAEVFMSAISLANSAGDRRYFHLRKYLVHYLLDNYRHVRFSSDRQDTCSIYVTQARNSHLRRRFYTPYQRDEMLGLGVVPARVSKCSRGNRNPLESYLYLRWNASRTAGKIPDFVKSAPRYDASGARLAGVWTPC